MRFSLTIAVLIATALLPRAAPAQINPIPLIIAAESSGNPTAQSATSTSSGLFGDVNATWAQALAACGNCGTVAQFPTAASAPAAVQIAANDALINQVGLQPWLCANCDPAFTAQVAAAGGVGAFQTNGLDTNPADFAGANTAAGLQAFLAGGGAAAGAGALPGDPPAIGAGDPAAGAGAAAAPALAPGQTVVTDLPGTGAGAGAGVLDQIVTQFHDITDGWQAELLAWATDLFWILALIELIVCFILLMTGGRPDWSDVVFTIIRWAMPVLLFWWLLQNGSAYANDIIQSMRQIGGAIGGAAISPSAILWAGVNIVSTIWNNSHGFLGMIEMIPVMIAAIPIIIAFALAAVWMLMALIEAYFRVGLAALFFAFAPLRWTRNLAISLLMSCLAIGFKLIALAAIAAVGTAMVTQWAANAAGLSFQGIFVMLGASIAFAAIAKLIPDSIERIVYGHYHSLSYYQAGQVYREAAATAAVVAAPFAGMAGFGALAWQLIKHAAETEARSITPPDSSRALQWAGAMGGAAVSAAGSEVGGRLGGLYRGGLAASGARMAAQVAQGRRVAAAEASRPAPPSSSSGGTP